MKNITKFFTILLISIFSFGSIVYAATTLYPNRGGTGIISYTTGDIIYSTGAKTLEKLNIGSNNQFLRSNGSIPIWQTISTSDISEGTNLYYTLNRWANAQSGTTTDSLSEGIVNFYATQERWDSFWNASTTLDSVTTIPNLVITESQISDLTHYTSADFDTDFANKDTDDLTEGVSNLYYTEERTDARIDLFKDWEINGSGQLTPTTSPMTVLTTDWITTNSTTTNATTTDLFISGDFKSSNVDITGGNMSGTSIGVPVPSAGAFTLLSANEATSTNLQGTTVGIGSEYYTSLTGDGLTISSGALIIDQSFTPTWTGLHIFQNGFISQASSTIEELNLGTPLDIGDYTNLSADPNYLVLSGDQMSFASTSINLFSTGWISGGEVTVNADNTKFDVAAGTGLVCDNHTDATNPSCTVVSWDATVANTVDTFAQLATRIGIDSSGSVVQSSGAALFTNEQNRDIITLGSIIHLDGVTIGFTTPAVDVVNFNTQLNIKDFVDAVGTSINQSGNVVSANGANLNLNTSAGSVYAFGLNRDNPKDPSVVSFSASTTIQWQYSFKNGSGFYEFGPVTDTVVPGSYDDGTGGVNVPDGVVADNRYSIQRVHLLASTGEYAIEFGQDTYASISEAIVGITTEDFTQNPLLSALTNRGWIILRGDATDLSDRDQARFCETDRFGLVPTNCGAEAGVSNMFNLGNGNIITQQNASTTSDGSTVTLSVGREGGGDLTVQFNGQNFAIDTTPATTTILTAGTNEVPVENFAYFIRNNEVCCELTSNTTGFPEIEHSPIGTYWVQSAENVQALGGGLYQDHMYDNSLGNGLGVIHDLLDRARQEHAVWENGVNLTLNGSGTGTVTMESTSGLVWQVHAGTMPAFASTTPFRVKNDSVSAYATSTNIGDFVLDSTGTSLTNKFYYLVIWGIRSQSASSSGLYINLPSTSFVSQVAAENEPFAADFTIPNEARGTGFMIAKVLMRNQSDATFTVISTDDIRGNDPGGVAGGGGINVPTDFQDGSSGFTIQNVADITKELQWDLSGITTGNTRTWTVPDVDTTMWADNGSVPLTANWDVGAFQITADNFISDGTADSVFPNFTSTNGTTTNATTTTFAISSLGTAAGTFLAVDPNGTVIATTTPIPTSASSTLLADNNNWTGNNTFANGTSTNWFSSTASSTNLFASVFDFGGGILKLVGKTISSIAGAIIDFGDASLEIPNSADPTLGTTGQVGVDTAKRTFNFNDGTAEVAIPSLRIFGFSISSTTDAENQPIPATHDLAYTVTEVKAKASCIEIAGCEGGYDFNLAHGVNRGATADLFAADINTTSTSTYTVNSSFGDVSIAADEEWWLTTSAATSSNLIITIQVFGRFDL